MSRLFLLALLVPLAYAVSCPTTYGPTNTTIVTGLTAFCDYCTRMVLTNQTTLNYQILSPSSNKNAVPYVAGTHLFCNSEPRQDQNRYYRGRFTAPGVTIESCAWDSCTLSINASNIECYTSDEWTNTDYQPTNTLLCKTNKCFKSTAKAAGRLVIGNTLYEYDAGSNYACGDDYCPLQYSDDNAQISCCTGSRCNTGPTGPQQPQTKGGSTLLSTSLVSLILGFKLFA